MLNVWKCERRRHRSTVGSLLETIFSSAVLETVLISLCNHSAHSLSHLSACRKKGFSEKLKVLNWLQEPLAYLSMSKSNITGTLKPNTKLGREVRERGDHHVVSMFRVVAQTAL